VRPERLVEIAEGRQVVDARGGEVRVAPGEHFTEDRAEHLLHRGVRRVEGEAAGFAIQLGEGALGVDVGGGGDREPVSVSRSIFSRVLGRLPYSISSLRRPGSDEGRTVQ
jgi:hypothetical protein